MGSKKRARKVLKLSGKAKAEIEALLKRDRAKNLTQKRLKTGLREVDEGLERILAMIRFFL